MSIKGENYSTTMIFRCDCRSTYDEEFLSTVRGFFKWLIEISVLIVEVYNASKITKKKQLIYQSSICERNLLDRNVFSSLMPVEYLLWNSLDCERS